MTAITIAALHTMGLATLTHTPSPMLQGSPASRSKTS